VKEAEMYQIPGRRIFARVALLALVALALGSCREHDYRSLNLNPNIPRYKTAKKTRLVPCDTTITANVSSGGVDLDAAFLCEKDMVTWQIAPNHTFHVKFNNGSPFVNGKSDFSEGDPSGMVKDKYDKLEVYKYSIQVDSLKPVDPQVIGGGNP
jgi:hypothetical protein